MGKWIKGDLHVHTHNCKDATLSITEILKRSCKYVDFIGFSGHAYDTPDCGEGDLPLDFHRRIKKLDVIKTLEQKAPEENVKRGLAFIESL